MKNLRNLFGLLAMVAFMACVSLSFTACGGGDDGDSITITTQVSGNKSSEVQTILNAYANRGVKERYTVNGNINDVKSSITRNCRYAEIDLESTSFTEAHTVTVKANVNDGQSVSTIYSKSYAATAVSQ